MTWRISALARCGAFALFALGSGAAAAEPQGQPPPIGTPFPQPDFHFSDPARDAHYWQLYAEMERSSEAFREALYAARRALAVPRPEPGTPRWREVRAAVQRAIEARRPARDGLNAMIRFATRERPLLSQAEAEFALDLRHSMEASLRGSSDVLVDLLASLADIPIGQWPP